MSVLEYLPVTSTLKKSAYKSPHKNKSIMSTLKKIGYNAREKENDLVKGEARFSTKFKIYILRI